MMDMIKPFDASSTLTIAEDAPKNSTGRTGIRAVVIRPARSTLKSKVNQDGVQALLDSLPEPEKLRLVEISYESRLRSVPNLTRFPNVQFAHVAGRSLKDYAPLYSLERLRSLYLVNYPKRDLDDFLPTQLEYLRAIRGSVSNLRVVAQSAHLQYCGKLVDLSGAAISSLTIESCNQLNCASIANIRGLERLNLLACKSLADFNWAQGCRSLQHLSVTAIPASHLDLDTLAGSAVPQLFLAVPKKKIAEVARRAPNSVVSNGDCWYRDGKPGIGDDPLLAD